MYIPHFSITPLIAKNLEAIGRVFGYLQAVQLPSAYRLETIAKVAAETVHASTAIEGNTLTQDQVERVLENQPVRAIKRDIREAKNYYQALQYVLELAKHTDQGFSQQTVLELHYRLLSGVDDEIAGKYRKGQVRVSDYLPPEAWQVPSLMDDFVDWLNKPTPQGLSPILYAGTAHYLLVANHPFKDGNGRTARALITLYLVKNGYDITGSFALESYYNRERAAYYDALSTVDRTRTADDKPDLTHWLEYFTTGFLVEAERAQSRINEYLEKREVQSSVSLTGTQRRILEITAITGTARMSDYLEKLKLSQRGVYKAIQKLVELELLIQSGERRGTRYAITDRGLQQI